MRLNKRGFAISTMLYGLIFVTIAVFYLIIAIISGRQQSNTDHVENIRQELKDLVIITK